MNKLQIINKIRNQLLKHNFKGHVTMKKEFNKIDIFVDLKRVGFFLDNTVYLIKEEYPGGCNTLNTKNGKEEFFLEI